jgi:hypothetical protein
MLLVKEIKMRSRHHQDTNKSNEMGLRNLHTDNSHQKLTNLLSSQLHKTPEKVVRNLNLVYEIQSLARKHPIKNHSKESPKTEATSQQYKVCVCVCVCATHL